MYLKKWRNRVFSVPRARKVCLLFRDDENGYNKERVFKNPQRTPMQISPTDGELVSSVFQKNKNRMKKHN